MRYRPTSLYGYRLEGIGGPSNYISYSLGGNSTNSYSSTLYGNKVFVIQWDSQASIYNTPCPVAERASYMLGTAIGEVIAEH